MGRSLSVGWTFRLQNRRSGIQVHLGEAIDNITPTDKYFGEDGQRDLEKQDENQKANHPEERKINKIIMLESLFNGID